MGSRVHAFSKILPTSVNIGPTYFQDHLKDNNHVMITEFLEGVKYSLNQTYYCAKITNSQQMVHIESYVDLRLMTTMWVGCRG